MKMHNSIFVQEQLQVTQGVLNIVIFYLQFLQFTYNIYSQLPQKNISIKQNVSTAI